MNNIESIMTQMIGNDPRFSRAVSMLQGKTPEQMQQIILNTAMSQGISQTQLAPLVDNIKKQFSMFGIQF